MGAAACANSSAESSCTVLTVRLGQDLGPPMGSPQNHFCAGKRNMPSIFQIVVSQATALNGKGRGFWTPPWLPY